jgi:hypothetical protein
MQTPTGFFTFEQGATVVHMALSAIHIVEMTGLGLCINNLHEMNYETTEEVDVVYTALMTALNRHCSPEVIRANAVDERYFAQEFRPASKPSRAMEEEKALLQIEIAKLTLRVKIMGELINEARQVAEDLRLIANNAGVDFGDLQTFEWEEEEKKS